jgi:hypothetical protein
VIRVAEAEEVLRSDPGTPLRAEDVVPRYRDAAEYLALRRHVLAAIPDPDQAMRALGRPFEDLHRETVLGLYQRKWLADSDLTRVSPGEVSAYYRDHPEQFHQDAQRFVWHIYRRHAPGARPPETLALLAGLKARCAAGEDFGSLAEKYSESETRLLQGKLGWIRRGRLPARIEGVVFSLKEGETSDPVPAPGGAMLFRVTEIVEEKQFPLEDVRFAVQERLRFLKRREAAARHLEDTPPPGGSTVLDRPAFEARLVAAQPGDVLLEAGSFRLTLEDFSRRLEKEGATTTVPVLSRFQRAWELYQGLAQDQLLYRKALASGFTDELAYRHLIDERVRRRGLDLLVQDVLEKRLVERSGSSPAALRRFYGENRMLYQSGLRVKLRILSAPIGPEPARSLAEVQAARDAVTRGDLGLDQAATRIGGQVRDVGWLDAAGLGRLEPKVRTYVLSLNSTGCSIPFQLNHRLNVVEVAEREEPRIQPYTAVAERVLTDYRERNQQKLFAEVKAEILRAEAFEFHPEAVKRALSPSGPAS